MLPGGQTDKLGNRYESWWTVQQLLRLIAGDALSIRLEPPGIEKAEFVLVTPHCTEYHQTKRSSDDGKWSLADLASSKYKVLQAIYPYLADNTNEFHLVSGSDAPELRELSERARLLETWEEFTDFGLEAEKHRKNFETRLLPAWQNPAGADAYQVLRRVFVHVTDEDQLKQRVTSELKSLYLADITEIRDLLRNMVQDKVSHTLTREELLDILKGRGYFLRRITDVSTALPAIEAKTTEYMQGIEMRLIGRTLIPRKSADEVAARVTAGNGLITALTGRAGGGKSGCTLQIVEMLRASGVPVLAFRLDRIPPVTTAAELGIKLGWEESPVLMLAAAAKGRPAVLVIDQLDAVSTISGRNSGFFEAVRSLLDEARGLSVRARIHVVVVCRKFDWENDHHLRGMVGKEDKVIELADFAPAEVTAALRSVGFDSASLSPRQMGLLQVPQNLALFLESPSARANSATFGSAKDLYDAYWKDKRAAVNERAKPEPERWNEIIETLTAAITESQQLSVPHECLDTFPATYLEQLVSEGVLSFDGRRYGFGHESFFDYCYARNFVRAGKTLLNLLQSGEQHLFRRAQVRQVLAYLRDYDMKRYCREIESLIDSPTVRTHIKDLTCSLLASVPVVSAEEWALLFSRIESYMAVIAQHGEHSDKAAIHLWRHFFGSQSWFVAANQRGVVAAWLNSDSDFVANLMTYYLRAHQRMNGDAVAALLEPYADAPGQWPLRLRCCMESAQHENSRRFFDLLLRLIDNGVLDEARCRFAQNGTFWSMLYGLTQAKREWLPEVFAHWLRRRLMLVTARQSEEDHVPWSDLWGDDDSGSVAVGEAARRYPEVFVENTFALFLEISDSAVQPGAQLPRHDAVWHNLYPGGYASMDQACQMALRGALEHLAASNADRIPQLVDELRQRDTYFANVLLFTIYTAGAARYADEAVELICTEQWRLQCGYSCSGYWLTRKLITAAAPFCSPERLMALESLTLNYVTEWELSANGRGFRGKASFGLLSAIPSHLRSEAAKARFLELQRKHKSPSGPPEGYRSGFVGPPIEKEKAARMTDDQWLGAIAKYDSEERKPQWEDFLKGGASQLARELEQFTRNDPERFGRLALRFPVGTNAVYLDRVLAGLTNSPAPLDLKLDVCRKAFAEARIECGKSIVDLLGSIEESLPDECIGMLRWVAVDHPDPDDDLRRTTEERKTPYHGGDIHNCGINCARGRAAEAVAHLMWHDAAYIERLMPVLRQLVRDRSAAVRSCAARALLAIAVHDAPGAIAMFGEWAELGPELLATPYADHFIYRGLREHFDAVRPFIETLLRADSEKPAEAGARLASLAVLYGHPANDLVEEALQGSASQRLGVAKVTASNFTDTECRTWCEPLLRRFFDDDDQAVRREAANCFSRLKEAPIGEFQELIAAYCASRAYQESSFWLLHILEESPYRLPGITCNVCAKFLERFSDEAKNVSTSRAGDARTVATLIYRTYQQHLDDEWAPRCLELIDSMLLEGIYDAGKGLEDFER